MGQSETSLETRNVVSRRTVIQAVYWAVDCRSSHFYASLVNERTTPGLGHFLLQSPLAGSNVLTLDSSGLWGLDFDGTLALDLGIGGEKDFEGDLPLMRSK